MGTRGAVLATARRPSDSDLRTPEKFRPNNKRKNVRVSKAHVKSYSFVSRNHGCYRPFGAIVQKEGGWNDKAAVTGATVMALKCIKTGGEWASRNKLTERLEFWHIKREHLDDFTQAWDMRRNEEEAMRLQRQL